MTQALVIQTIDNFQGRYYEVKTVVDFDAAALAHLTGRGYVDSDATVVAAAIAAGARQLTHPAATMTPDTLPLMYRADTNQMVGEAARRATAEAAALVAAEYCPLPTTFNWTASWTPQVYLQNGTYYCPVNPREHVNPAIWTGTAYHVDVVNGSTSNTGLGLFDGDFTNAMQQISAAITAGNATGAPYRIYVRAGYYAGSRCINGSAQNVEPNQHCAIIAVGGPVYNVAGDGAITWTQDGTYTNLYKYTVANIARVFDLAQTDADGAPLEYTAAADLATCNSTDNTYILTGGVLYINRADGQPATTANTIVTRALTAGAFITNTSDIYIEGFKFFGGVSGAFHVDPVASRNVITVNCEYVGAGSASYLFDGYRVRRTNGLVLDVNGKCYANAADGFDFHYDNGPSGGKMHVVLINPIGNGNGRYTSTSNNGITTHDDVRMIAVEPTCIANRTGADLHQIEDTETVIFGGTLSNTSAGGATPNAALKASNNAKIWTDGTAVSATTGDAIYAQSSGARIYMKRPPSVVGYVRADSGAVIANW